MRPRPRPQGRVHRQHPSPVSFGKERRTGSPPREIRVRRRPGPPWPGRRIHRRVSIEHSRDCSIGNRRRIRSAFGSCAVSELPAFPTTLTAGRRSPPVRSLESVPAGPSRRAPSRRRVQRHRADRTSHAARHHRRHADVSDVGELRRGVFSGSKISSISFPKTRPIAKASGRLGAYRPVSIALTVWRETRRRSASSACDQSRSARRTCK